jgi:predicted PurR-regulated permease PerM
VNLIFVPVEHSSLPKSYEVLRDQVASVTPPKIRIESMQDQSQRHPLAVPVYGIFLLALVQALLVASEFLIPVTGAILAYFLLNAPRRGLARLGIGAPIAAAIFTLIIGTTLTLSVMALAQPVTNFVEDIPALIDDVRVMARNPGGPFEALSEAAAAAGDAVDDATSDNGNPMEVQIVDGPGVANSVVSLAPGLFGQLAFSLCLLFFLVASGDLFIKKAVQVVDSFHDKKQTFITIRMIERRLGNYLGAITLINCCLGLCIGVAMWWWGMPSPWLIGLMGTVLNFVPFVGALVGSLLAGVIALVTFMAPWTAAGVLLTYYGLTAFEGQFATPALVGKRLRLNVVVVFMAVAFFAWIWSVIGMIVAVPMLIVIKVICDSVPKFRKIGLFLGDADVVSSTDDEDRRHHKTSGDVQ